MISRKELMPKPFDFETIIEFSDRCMNNSIMKEDFPDDSQRFSVCNSVFEQKGRFIKSDKKMIKPVYKSIATDLSDFDFDGKTLKLKGIAISFDNIDKDGDFFDAKSVKKTIEEKGTNIGFLYNHMWNAPLSIKLDEINIKNVGVEYVVTIDGLKYWGFPYESKKQVVNRIIEGELKKHSFMFTADWDKTEQVTNGGKTANYFKEIKLWEFSILDVPPANDNTPLLSVECQGDACKTLNHLKGQITNDEQIQYLAHIFEQKPQLLKSLLDYVPSESHEIIQPKKESTNTNKIHLLNYL